MIDTVKIYTMINKNIYDKIYNNSIVKSSVHLGTGEVFYQIVNDSLKGSYDSSLSVRVGCGSKYHFVNMYYLEIEGSYHKIIKGFNAYNGCYSLLQIVNFFIDAVEVSYNVKLPTLKHWFLQRCDIAICFDLCNNKAVRNYINNLSLCNYPRRNIKHYQDESIYCSGTSTTLKIYNKMLEFKKHDMKKLFKTNFDIDNYLLKIDGFVRFECEIKKKKLEAIYNKKYIRVINVCYNVLRKVWSDEFMKFLKLFESDLYIVRSKEDVKNRLFNLYDNKFANLLYSFYIRLMAEGYNNLKDSYPRSTFYRYIKNLREAGVDLTQRYTLEFDDNYVDFNPFEWKEVI